MFSIFDIPENVTGTREKINHLIGQTWLGDNEIIKVIVVFLVAGLTAYLVSKVLAKIVVWIARQVAVEADNASSEERFVQLRRVETYLSVFIALMRFVIVVTAVLGAWYIVAPKTSDGTNTATAIGAGTIFAVTAGASLGILLRDITAGITMIIEQWFNVGDHIRVIPFAEIQGVVERMTLRSTKVRLISGEVTHIHNQHILGVIVTPRGVRTEMIDVFVDKLDPARKAIEELMKTLDRGPTMLATPMRIQEVEEVAKNLWRISIVGQTIPGREWVIENFFVDTLKSIDEENKSFKIVYGPIVRFVDETAEKRFKRAMRVKR
ncbi:mechanosensitive ion channel family protein [Candidatus Saccharibacteria bacterium]|nr:mechanosensitive ion channel family protein [Candidatus Saccharibacteria bacterium]